MTIYYSASTRGFYDDSIHMVSQIPEDAVEISQEYHAKLLDEQSKGKVIEPDHTGFPKAVVPPPPPVKVPESISAANGMIYLHRQGLLDEVEAFVKDPATDLEFKIAYERQTIWRRDSPLVDAVRKQMRWTNAQVDEMFIEAAKI